MSNFDFTRVANAIKSMYHHDGFICFVGEWRAMMYVFDNEMILAIEKIGAQSVLYSMSLSDDSYSSYRLDSNAIFDMDDVLCGCTHVGNTIMLQRLLQTFADNLDRSPEFKDFFNEFMTSMCSSSF